MCREALEQGRSQLVVAEESECCELGAGRVCGMGWRGATASRSVREQNQSHKRKMRRQVNGSK